MQHFTPLAVPAEQSVDPVVVRYAGGEFASYIDTDSAAPFMTGLRAALEAPLHSSQVLNTAIALSNVVALLALSLAQDESEAVDLVNGSIRRSATVAFPELVPESTKTSSTVLRHWCAECLGQSRATNCPMHLTDAPSRRSQPSATRRSCSRIRLACHGPYWQRPLVKLPQRCSVAMSLAEAYRVAAALPVAIDLSFGKFTANCEPDGLPRLAPDHVVDIEVLSIVIQFEHVSKRYKAQSAPALDDISLEIAEGEFTFLVGPSGSGKSTFLRLLLREEKATSGEVIVNGKDIAKCAVGRCPHSAAAWEPSSRISGCCPKRQ